MKKACIYILLPFFLLNGTLLEFCKIPAFFSHFITHHEKGNVSLFRFISMHYLGNDINDNDDEEDMKLPFKKAESHNFLQFKSPLQNPAVQIKQHTRLIGASLPVPYNYPIDDPSLDTLFRPPRSANS